jgi:hypothetical protein
MSGKNIMLTDHLVRITPGDLLLISDCRHAEIFRASAVKVTLEGQKITTEQPLKQTFQRYAEVSPLRIHKYYLAQSRYQGERVTYALMRDTAQGRSAELVSGIEHLKFRADSAGIFIEFESVDHTQRLPWQVYASNLSG